MTTITTAGQAAVRDPLDAGPYQLEIRACSPAQMQERVARYTELKCPPNRYPDSHLPGRQRKNFLVIGKGLQVEGAQPPMPAIPIAEGFQLGYATMKPGNGPALHNHDTNETFIAVKGTWRVTWGLDQANSVELGHLDVCSVPAFVPRTFVCLSADEGEEEGLLMAIIAGDAPRSEFN